MGYFPFFVDIADKNGLIVGGGTVALRKVEKLLPYRPRLTVAAPELSPELEAIPALTLVRAPFAQTMLDSMFFVIAATDQPALNRRIARLCRERSILVNVVDDREACTFLFPALVKRGALSVGISTGGASPSAAVHLKNQISALVPEHFEALLDHLNTLRPQVKAALPEADRHAAAFARLFTACMEAGRPLTQAEVEGILADFAKRPEEHI